MTNLEKMNTLMGSTATKEMVKRWGIIIEL